MTAVCRINVNGKQVAFEQFSGKNENKVSRDASHWLCNTEFAVRSVLQAAGVESATIRIISDNVIIEHVWGFAEGSEFGYMFEGKVIA